MSIGFLEVGIKKNTLSRCLKLIHDFIAGHDEDYQSLNSTEVVVYNSSDNSWDVHESADLDESSNHLNMDFKIYAHCVVNFDDRHMFLIGGVTGGDYDSDLDDEEQEDPVIEDRTWFIDMEDNFFEVKPFHFLRMRRRDCQAAVMNSRGRRVIVVAGGNNGNFDTLDSIEIIDPKSNERWKEGKEVEQKRVSSF